MKNFILLLVCATFLYSCNFHSSIVLTENNQSDYKIVLSDVASKIELKAAKELQKHIKEISNVKLPIVSDGTEITEFEILIGESKHLTDLDINNKDYDLKEDGYFYYTRNNKIIFLGGSDKGVLNGVYTFLEDELGCRFYSSEVIKIPKLEKIELPILHKTHVPYFTYRELHTPFPRTDEKYLDWHKLDFEASNSKDWGMFVHTFDDLIPHEKYFDEHPEYFGELGGQRIRSGQLCLSNADLYDELLINLRKRIDERPEPKYWSVSQNDNYLACQCDECKKLDEQYGGPSGTMIWFVNQLADEYPDKIISTLAYQYTRHAPKNIIPRKNVNVVLCSIECNRSESLQTDERSADFRTDMQEWGKLTDNILVWDYVVQFRNYMSPFPNLRVLQPNLQFFANNHARMMFQQGSGGSISEFIELRSYLIAKFLWDQDADYDKILNDFVNGYYENAAPSILKYIELLHNSLEDSKGNLGIYGYPFDGINTFLTPELISEYNQLFDDAEASVKNNPEVLNRVKVARLPLEFAMLDLSMRSINDELCWFRKVDGEWEANQPMLDRLDRFVEMTKANGIERIEEHGTKPEEYRKTVLHYIQSGMQDHLALKKPAEVLSEYSNTYDVGGGKALTDGLFGITDYHFNWLGFEGNHMEAVVDLGSSQNIKTANCTFLQESKSWIYLPLEMVVFISDNGSDYKKIGSVENTISDKQAGSFTEKFEIKGFNEQARYIKVFAKSRLTNPDWHIGAGSNCWIFVDEIVVN